MSTNVTKVPRLALSSITLNDENKQAGSVPFKIFISDGFRVHEAYNPDYVSDFFYTLPEQLRNSDNLKKERLKRSRGEFISGHTDLPSSGSCGDSISGHSSGRALTGPYEEEMEHEEEEDIEDSVTSQGSKRKLSDYEEELQDGGDSCSGHDTDLVLTGPNGDIVPWDYFDVIVHQNIGDRTIDDSHFKNSYNLYLAGKRADPSDIICTWRWHTINFLNKVDFMRLPGPFGSLSLDFIVFRDSRLVTVDVKLFLEEEGIVGVGPDGKINHATESSYICGKLSFHNSAYDDAVSVLLKTPEDKGIKLAHGESIRLLRNKVAIPVCKFFTVQASLKDPVTNSVFKGPVIFAFDSFSEEENYLVSKELVGRGAKIVVNVTMLPNDVNALGGV